MIFVFFQLILLLTPLINEQDDLIKKLDAISITPEQISIDNKLKIEKKGGHLQGIQTYRYNDETYLYASGSSSQYGYLVSASETSVKRLHVLRKKPLKHAGGFQISNNWLAVGIEDNELRNVSEVHVYQLKDPFDELILKAVIDRKGDWERATAGAVAIIEWENRLLMLVGDWSNRNVDFYHASLDHDRTILDFQKSGEIEMATYDKKDWVDDVPWPYQNINLVKYGEQLLLFGFSSGEGDANVLDVYELEDPFSKSPLLTKIYSRTFPKTKSTRFGWGAGIQYENNKFTLYSCGENILKQMEVARYSSH
tara:strand:- start:28 stop:957 length:930 start_codon:yes stop_codon:yes gene_type:complete